MPSMTEIVYLIGTNTGTGIEPLGTGFLVASDGRIATAHHVIRNEQSLVMFLPKTNNLNSYQDTTDRKCKVLPMVIDEIDPIRDIAILKPAVRVQQNAVTLSLGSFDEVSVDKELHIFGFPHCKHRTVLTMQRAELGAKILLESNTIKSEHAVVNFQSRPGQSGSMVYAPCINQIVGMLVGTFAPTTGGFVSMNGINPEELNQTTHCISAKYIKNML